MVIKIEINPTYEWDEDAKKLGISHKELEVMALLAQGYSNEEIADILPIQYQSVKNHMYNLTKKMKVNNTMEALSIAVGRGMLRIENTERPTPEDESKAVKVLRIIRKAVQGEDTQLAKKIKRYLIRHGADIDV